MKATLEFDLPEEHEAHMDAVNGSEWKYAMQAVDETLRNWLKHGSDHENKEQALQAVRDALHEELRNRSLDLYS